jgi:hypothetical protein
VYVCACVDQPCVFIVVHPSVCVYAKTHDINLNLPDTQIPFQNLKKRKYGGKATKANKSRRKNRGRSSASSSSISSEVSFSSMPVRIYVNMCVCATWISIE